MQIKEMDMLNGNLWKKIIIFTIPVMLSSILQLLFNACDLMVVGKFSGDNSLAAVGSTSSLIHLIINLFIGISVGANVVVARSVGSRDEIKTQNAVHTAVLFSVISGFILTIIGAIGSEYFLKLMDTPIEVLDKATLYLRIYFFGMIFNMVYNYGAAILRGIGETKKPLYYLFFSGVINVILNLFFVLVFNMDVDGVAIATIVSQGISAILVIRYLMRYEGFVHLDLRKLRIEGVALKEMTIIGLPAGIQGSLFSISNVFIQRAINSFGSTAIVAGNTAASNIEGFVHSSMASFSQACLTFTSQNYGAGKLENCKKVLKYCLASVAITGFVLGFSSFIFARPLLGLYINGSEAIRFGIIRLTIIGLTYFICGLMDVIVGGLRGLGYSIVPMIVSIAGICAFRLLWIYTIFEKNHTIRTLYISYPISWVLTGAVHLFCYVFIFVKMKKVFEIENIKELNEN